MDPRLLDYYNQELAHVREMGAEFAREFPKIAARLGVEGLEVADPYVERLLEGFAFIAARVQLKIDAEFPRFTQHLLEIVYPHYLTPTPSAMIVEFKPNYTDTALVEGVRLAPGTALRSVVPRGEQTACEFRTAHDLTLWPIELVSARYFSFAPDLPLGQLGIASQVRGGLRLKLAARAGTTFSKIACDELSLHLSGADELIGPLFEATAARCIGAIVVTTDTPPKIVARLDASQVTPDGFDDDQALLPFGRRSFQGYRLLREYFWFPQRFNFLRIAGLTPAFRALDARECEIVLLFDRADGALEGAVDEGNFSLYATPAVNVFARRADRIHLSEGQHEHHLVVDRTRPMDFEVFSVNTVKGLGDDAADATEFAPFYGDLVHHESLAAKSFYTVRREPRVLSERQRTHGPRTGYVGNEVFLSIVDEREAPYPRSLKQLAVEVLATNRDLPLLLPIASTNTLMLDDAAPVESVRVLKGPTRPRTGLAEGDYAWRLLSHLSLNYLSLFDAGNAGGAVAAIRELLSLYSNLAEPAQRKQIESVIAVQSRPVVRRLPIPGPITFGRGLAIDLTLGESGFGGAGGFVLGSVLERFFARHVSINSFTQMRLVSESRGEVATWPARTGTRIIA